MTHESEQVVSRHPRLGRWLLTGYGALIYVFLFAPIVLLVLFSFNDNPAGSFPITGWSTKWYTEAFNDFELQESFWTSLEVAVQVSAISVVVGTATAFSLVRARLPARTAVRIWLTLPIMLPGLLIGVSLLILFATVLDLELSSRTAVIGQCLFTTPFVILLVAARLETLDRRLEWAASDLGADAWRRLRFVILPALAPAILASALLAFALSLDEFIITLFVIGDDQTLPLYIYNHVRFGITPAVNAVASLFMAATFATLALGLAMPGVVRRIRIAWARVRRRRARVPVA